MKSAADRKLRQVPQGYLVIGVDPHNKKHAAVAITQDVSTHAKLKFSNSSSHVPTHTDRTVERNAHNYQTGFFNALSRGTFPGNSCFT